MNIELQITAAGGVEMLHDDAVDLNEFGTPEVTRASNVEYANPGMRVLGFGPLVANAWYVQSAKTNTILKDGFLTRAEALAWEKTYYSPSGPGWTELTQEVA